MLMKNGRWIILLTVCSMSLGCASLDVDPARNAMFGNPLYEHRCPLVRYPSTAGFYTGAIVGLPLLASGIFCAEAAHMGEGGLIFVRPWVLFASATGAAVGAPCWAVFGWWWPEATLTEPLKPKEQQDTLHALGPPTNS